MKIDDHNVCSLTLDFVEYRFNRNFKKRIIKTPMLYFFDTGLACHLLGIDVHAVEVKSGMTVQPAMVRSLENAMTLWEESRVQGWVVYGGNE